MRYFFGIFFYVLLVSPALSQPVVLDAKPTTKVESHASSTTRSVLSKADQDEYRVRIAKKGNQYIWVSRENRELVHQSTAVGTVHYFIDPRGGGYIKVFDTFSLPKSIRTPGPRYEYMEHLSLLLGTITYWGATDLFEP
jgi:hypothetical protein